MKYLKKFNEERIYSEESLDFFTALDNFHEENDVDSSCHTTLDNFASYLSENYEIVGKVDEGVAMKASKSKDSDVKKGGFRDKIENFIKSKEDCKPKQIGDDLEVHCNDEHIAQVMFRDDYIGVKKEGNKFPKEFKYNELGKIKKELSSIVKDCCK